MRKALPVILFTVFLAGCHGGGSAPVTVTKTVTVPASKPRRNTLLDLQQRAL